LSKPILTPGALATLACCLEVAAPKPGNVNRIAEFENTRLEDFLSSGVILGQVIDQTAAQSTGATILQAVRQTQKLVGTNTNLGIILLIVPMAKAIGSPSPAAQLNRDSIGKIFDHLSPQDAQDVFAAIRIANPGGLGTTRQFDVQDTKGGDRLDLLTAMDCVAHQDLVARQYTNRCAQLFDLGLPAILAARKSFGSLNLAIAYAHVYLMACFPDGLIWRKSGEPVARHSQNWAAQLIEKLPLLKVTNESPLRVPPVASSEIEQTILSEERVDSFWRGVAEFDFWLRSDGNKRNPGTTADLITGSLFLGMARGDIQPPYR